MKKGYGIIYNNGVIISSVKDVKVKDDVEIRLSDGSFNATVLNITNEKK